MNLKYFDIKEFDCKETGENHMQPAFLKKLDKLRDVCGFPFVVTSGYRSPNHSVERNKKTTGKHTQGIAADIATSDGSVRYKIIEEALKLGFTGIGVAKTFIHLDTREGTPVIWSY